MKIIVNGSERECECATVAQLFERERREKAIETIRGYAIALNGAVVRRERWPQTNLTEGDRVEIVRAFAGG